MCELLGISRQAYYKEKKVRQRREINEGFVLQVVDVQRQKHPRMGTRKLKINIEPDLQEVGLSIGRDLLNEILRKHDRLVKPKRKSVRTTCSRHNLRFYENLLKEAPSPSAPHQVWVADITYLDTDDGYLYLSLIMDL